MIANDSIFSLFVKNKMFKLFGATLFLMQSSLIGESVKLGIDSLIENYGHLLKGKRIGILTNHTAINGDLKTTIEILNEKSSPIGYKIVAYFAPEHGITGSQHADESVKDLKNKDGIPIYSLHGKVKRPTKEMLDRLDALVYDIQDIGCRSYTYISTLFFVMEEAAKWGKHVIVLDRPNPINGVTVDGPMMKEELRSIVGYLNVPYCHGMTVGELARFFNAEYKVGCQLTVIPMRGWKRTMTFADTGLFFVPTSPHIPEATTVWYYPTTGILGELSLVSIGVGYTLPFKVIGAPWIDAYRFSNLLNQQKFPGVAFLPFHFKPFYGPFAKKECHGSLIQITDKKRFLPVSTQYLILGILKALYPKRIDDMLKKTTRKQMFCKVNGTEEVWRILNEEKDIVWKLRAIDQKARERFCMLRKKYLLPEYD